MKYLVNMLSIVIAVFGFVATTHASEENEGNVSIEKVLIYEKETPNGADLKNDDRYGMSVANIGDLNGDGVDDFAIGAIMGDDKNGEIFIHFMNEDGTIKRTKKINSSTKNSGLVHDDYNRYGSAIVGFVDGNGDKIIAVGAEGEYDTEEKTRGSVYLHFMNEDGTIKKTKKIISPEENRYQNDMFGSALASADYNGDGNIDLAVGSKGNDEGYVYILFLDEKGNKKNQSFEITKSSENGPNGLSEKAMYGASIANLGDIDSDGINDIIVGAPNATGEKGVDECEKGKYCQVGAVYVHLMNDDGSVKKTIEIYADSLPIDAQLGDRYGKSVAGSDFNKDGIIDLVVGSPGKWGNEGVVYVHYLNEELEVVETETIDDNTQNGARENDGDDFYGTSVANVGDFDRNGIDDLLVGSKGFEGGMAYLHLLNKSLVENQSNQKDTSGELCDTSEIKYTPIYRLYNTRTGFHLYTRGEEDRESILNRWNDFEFTDNMPAFYASLEKTCENTTPIYRLYNNRTGAHLYTRGEADKDKILAKYKDFEFTDWGPAFYASLEDDGTTPIYRLYNTRTGVHLYTVGEADRNKILKKYPDFEFTDNRPAFYARTTN